MFGKKVACSFIVFALVFSMTLLPVTAQQNTEKGINPLTVDSYKKWLATSEQPAIPPVVANAMRHDIEIFALESMTPLKLIDNAELLTSFNSLDKEHQERFISYLNDEELMNDVFTALIKRPTKPLAGGDITITETKTQFNTIVPGTRDIFRKTVTAQRSAYIYGMLFGQAINVIVFDHNGTTITNIVGYGAQTYVVNPNVGSISGPTYDAGLSGNKAYHIADMIYQYGNYVTYEQWCVWGSPTSEGEW